MIVLVQTVVTSETVTLILTSETTVMAPTSETFALTSKTVCVQKINTTVFKLANANNSESLL